MAEPNQNVSLIAELKTVAGDVNCDVIYNFPVSTDARIVSVVRYFDTDVLQEYIDRAATLVTKNGLKGGGALSADDATELADLNKFSKKKYDLPFAARIVHKDYPTLTTLQYNLLKTIQQYKTTFSLNVRDGKKQQLYTYYDLYTGKDSAGNLRVKSARKLETFAKNVLVAGYDLSNETNMDNKLFILNRVLSNEGVLVRHKDHVVYVPKRELSRNDSSEFETNRKNGGENDLLRKIVDCVDENPNAKKECRERYELMDVYISLDLKKNLFKYGVKISNTDSDSQFMKYVRMVNNPIGLQNVGARKATMVRLIVTLANLLGYPEGDDATYKDIKTSLTSVVDGENSVKSMAGLGDGEKLEAAEKVPGTGLDDEDSESSASYALECKAKRIST